MKTSEWLRTTTTQFKTAGIESARLDALLLLEYTLKQNRASILAHDDQVLSKLQLAKLALLRKERLKRKPLAYITGEKEFFGQTFLVTKNVLIPRPETESLIEQVQALSLPKNATIIDVGTGSGALAISLKLLYPSATVTGIDNSRTALAVARKNAKRLDADIDLHYANLLSEQPGPFDCIVANLPYVNMHQATSPETSYEPAQALFAQNDGLDLIFTMIDHIQANPEILVKHGYIVLEAEPRQMDRIIDHARGFKVLHNKDFCLVLQRK